MNRTNIVFLIIGILALGIIGCGPHHGHRRHSKKVYGTVYQGSDSHYYTRSYDDNNDVFVYWMFMDGGSPASSLNATSSSSWSRMSTIPDNLTATSKVVEEEEGIPTEEMDEASTTPADETINEATTETQAEGIESASESSPSSDATDATSSDGNSGDTGGDSGGGDSGGGDGGGGDGGGGGD